MPLLKCHLRSRSSRRSCSAWAIAIGVVAILAAAPVARAAEDDAVAAAEELLREGLELRRAHRELDTLDRIERAHALSPTPRHRAQLGLAYQGSGRWLEAERELDQALAVTGDAWIERQRVVLTAALAVVRSRLGWLELRVDDPDARVVVDGVDRGEARSSLRVFAGERRVEITAPGRTPWASMLTVGAGERAVLAVSLSARPTGAPAPRTGAVLTAQAPGSHVPALRAPSGTQRTIAVVALGAGAVGIGVGAVAGVIAMRSNDDAVGRCPATDTCADAEGVRLSREASRQATVSTVAFSAGGALLLGGLVAYLIAPRGAGVAAAPRVSESVVGLDLTGRF